MKAGLLFFVPLLLGCQSDRGGPAEPSLEAQYAQLREQGFPLDDQDFVEHFRPVGARNAFEPLGPELVEMERRREWLLPNRESGQREIVEMLAQVASYDVVYSEKLSFKGNSDEAASHLALSLGQIPLEHALGKAVREGNWERTESTFRLKAKVRAMMDDGNSLSSVYSPFPSRAVWDLVFVLKKRPEWRSKLHALLPEPPPETAWLRAVHRNAFKSFSELRSLDAISNERRSAGLPRTAGLRDVAAQFLKGYGLAGEQRWDEAVTHFKSANQLMGSRAYRVSPMFRAFFEGRDGYWEARRLLEVGIRLEQQLGIDGAYPNSLEDLSLEQSQLSKVRYLKIGRGYRLWTFGPNGRDQGGIGRDKVSKQDFRIRAYDNVLVRE